MIGYTVTTVACLMAVRQASCFRKYGEEADCRESENFYMIGFGVLEVILAQLPNLGKITVISVIAAAMSFAYSFIGLGLCIGKLIADGRIKGTLTGAGIFDGVTLESRTWDAFQALGNIAFAYCIAPLLIEIQDTLKSPPPETRTMKRASLYGIAITALFNLSLGCIGYAAFGNSSPRNFLTGFQSYGPFWLVDIGNLCIVIHLIGAYQVFAQPAFALFESLIARAWPSTSTAFEFRLPRTQTTVTISPGRLVFRTLFVAYITVLAMVMPFFNAIMGLLGAVIFWPLTVKFPVSMYMRRENIAKGTSQWYRLQALSMVTLAVSLVAGMGSLAGLGNSLKHAISFKNNH
ncbi:amino acid permease 2-like [Nymphaea colorata]|nr:amino acid permease 2-like [Nymphaea colorata]XP_031474164.1 amino acid permease 2-like [Nymphaea colorata]